jgi:alpha-glucoside transport system permease protein
MSTPTGTDVDPFVNEQMLEDGRMGIDPISPKKRSAGSRASKAIGTRIGTIIVLVLAVLWTIPTFGVFISSFRPEQEVKTTWRCSPPTRSPGSSSRAVSGCSWRPSRC